MCGWTDLRITKTLQTRWKIIFFFLRYNLNTLKVSTDAIWAQKNKLEQIVKSHHCSLNHRVKFQTVWNDSFIFKTLTNISYISFIGDWNYWIASMDSRVQSTSSSSSSSSSSRLSPLLLSIYTTTCLNESTWQLTAL